MTNKQRTLVASVSIVTLLGIGILFLKIQGSEAPSFVGTAHADTCDKNRNACYPEIDLEDTNGTFWTPETLKGNVVMINFWADWCGPCISEIPDLSRVYTKHKDKGFVLLGLQRDWNGSDALDAFRKRTGLNYPVVVADYDVSLKFGLPSALPTTFIYDRDGKLVYEHKGPISEGQLEQIIRPMLD